MEKFGSAFSIVLIAILVPWIIKRLPYFKQPDVVARKALKAKLPTWVRQTETLILLIFACALTVLFFQIEQYVHEVIHPQSQFLNPRGPTSSLDFFFLMIEALAPCMLALPLSMILANVVAWSIPAIRNVENSLMAEGVAGYNWKDLNMGLLKFAAIVVPISLVAAFISLRNL